jgi:hypothetical protein
MRYAQHAPVPAIDASVDERAAFIVRTYAHLAGAMAAFVAIEAGLFLFAPDVVELLVSIAFMNRFSWLIFLGGFMAVSWVADRWARGSASQGMQYAGLGLYVVAEAILFVPLIFLVAFALEAPDILPKAGVITLVLFGGLTGVVFITRKDFSFLKGILGVAGLAAIGIIVASILFGFSLGSFFAGAMILLAGGYIIYTTSNILHHYDTRQHVAASLALFASVALLLWYVIVLLSNRRS